MTLELNRIYCGDCLDLMREIPDNSIDLTVTSPPYDKLRTYNGYTFKFKPIPHEMYRITKTGGVVVWIVSDETKDGSESGTSFKQALSFMRAGFNLHDTMIFAKNNYIPLTHNRYEQSFEYMFVFSKGKPKTFNPLMKDNKQVGLLKGGTFNQDGSSLSQRHKDAGVAKQSIRPNIFFYNVGMMNSSKDRIAFKHRAIFPESLAEEQILSWSNQSDLVLDPFVGCGTTAKMAAHNGRNFIGIEISPAYCDIANIRLKSASGGEMKPSKKKPRVPQDDLTWCFGKFSRRDPICVQCVVYESCIALKEM